MLKTLSRAGGRFGAERGLAVFQGGRRLLTGLLMLFAMLGGCSSPGKALQQQAEQAGARPLLLTGRPFLHQSYYRPGNGKRLHVYLEGDGTPWIFPTRTAPDPTSREPVALQMMALDPAPVLYLGRPCYNGLAESPDCSVHYWTGGRYSEAVVSSLQVALEDFLRQHSFSQLVLIGYSGGGTLATLLAPRIGRTLALVTLAANLDIDRWTGLHGYSPLADSLNPALMPAPAVAQLHFAGNRDRVVPLSLIRSVIGRWPGARLTILDRVDHHCCWVKLWPQLLQQIDELAVTSRSSGFYEQRQ